jgi:CheY-like chemotaxis protein
MSSIDYACVFVRATGDRLAAAERLVCGFPHLFGAALAEVDLAYRLASSYLVVVLRFRAAGFDPRMAARLGFWTARAGGRASPLGGMPAEERAAFDGHLAQCERALLRISPADLFDRSAALFTEVGAPAGRRRSAADRPMLAMDVGGPGWEGVSYRPDARVLFVAAPMAPAQGDELLLVFRIPGLDKPVGTRARVVEVRPPADATPGHPAGFGLAVSEAAPAIHDALARHAPRGGSEVRVAPRYAMKAPVKVLVPAPPPAVADRSAPAPPQARATIEYASDQELEADFIENLSQGGAFIRSSHPQAVGTPISLDFKLPNGTTLKAQALVAFANGQGMGVRFTLDAEAEATLQAAIAHISARPRRALVVDDDATVRAMIADALAERGFEVLTATDGQDGLRVVSEELLGLDLLVTDVFMPGLDGEAFLRTIRQAGGEADLAIVVITGRMEPGLERRLEKEGADAVLDKALGPELMAQAADAVLERKRMMRGA